MNSNLCSTSVFFFRNGKFIEENEKYSLRGSNTELTVRNIINSDGGPYVCKATNKAGEDEKQVLLQVFGKYYSTVVKSVISRGRSESNWKSLCCLYELLIIKLISKPMF
jgi:hypothetical protein